MTPDTLPPCALGLTPRTLSAWRDNALDAREMARVRTHAVGCAACRGQLEAFEAVARTVRGQRTAAPDARLWRGVRNRIEMERNMKEHGADNRHAGPHGGVRGRTWTGLAGVAAAVLLIAGFALVLRGILGGRGTTGPVAGTPTGVGTPSVTSSPTSAPTPPPLPLTWQSVALPAGFGTRWNYQFAPPSMDGNTAYACAWPRESGDTSTAAWTTRDRGAHWAQVVLPVGHVLIGCIPVADGNDPLVALMWMSWAPLGAPPDPAQAADFVTYDGGASWQRLPAPLQHVPMLATWHGVTYATGVSDKGSQLWVSSDHMRTWEPVGDGTLPVIGQIWVSPGNGAVTAVQEPPGGGVSIALQIWTSPDGHAWSRETTPKVVEVFGGPVLVGAGSPRLALCGVDGLGLAPHLFCADASGTWVERPNLTITGTNTNGQNITAPGSPFAIASDGALLAAVAWPSPTDASLYRLSPGASAWQSLGTAPLSSVAYGATSTGGVLWATGNGASAASYP